MGNIQKRSAALIGLTLFGLLAAVNPVWSAEVNPHTSYTWNNFSGFNAEIPQVKVAWSTTMDLQSDETAEGKGSAAVGGNKAYVIQQGQLIAINVQSGKLEWKYGPKLSAPLLYQDGVIYASSQTGTIHAVNAATGKGKWKSSVPSKALSQLIVDQKGLLAVNGDIQAYSLKDGKFQWRDNYSEAFSQPVVAEGNLVLAKDIVSGAYSYDLLHAFDRTTGKQLWEARDHTLPIAFSSGTLLSQRTSNLMQMVPLTTLDTLDAKTGKVLKTTEYNPNNVDPASTLDGGGKAWTFGDQLFISSGGPTVYSYPADVDPAKAVKETYSVAGNGASMSFAAGPYDGRVLFSDGESVYGIKTASKGLVTYYGGGDIARFDLLGHGMYIARGDGRVVAIHLITGAVVLQLQTSGRAYGPTLLENGMILVQSRGNLTAFKEPTSLKTD